MPLEWQVIAMGCGALVLTVMTSLRSKPGTAAEESGSHARRSGEDIRVKRERGESVQRVPLNSRIR